MINKMCTKKTPHPAKDDSGEMLATVGFSVNSKVASSCRWTVSKNTLTGRNVALATDAVTHTKLVPFARMLQLHKQPSLYIDVLQWHCCKERFFVRTNCKITRAVWPRIISLSKICPKCDEIWRQRSIPEANTPY